MTVTRDGLAAKALRDRAGGLGRRWMTVTRILCASGRALQSQRTALAFGLGVLLAALAVRWWLLEGAGWLLEADDALSALMAIDILDGDRPLMLRQQAYAGAWQPYLMAVCYELFGASRVSARLPALAASLALVGTTWLLAREVGGTVAGRFAAVLMALPPVYILVLSLKPWAPYTEVAVLGSLALWCATRLVVRRDRGRDGARALACGV